MFTGTEVGTNDGGNVGVFVATGDEKGTGLSLNIFLLVESLCEIGDALGESLLTSSVGIEEG